MPRTIIDLPSEQIEALDRLRAQRHMTREVIELLTKAGLFRAMLPRKFGGLELEPTAFFRALIYEKEA